MPPFHCIIATLSLTAVLFPATAQAATPVDPEKSGWQALRERRPGDALPFFKESAASRDAARVGRAVSLLGAQPRTRANVNQADEILASVERGEGDAALAAAYLRARVAEVHAFEPDPALAATRYEALLARAPSHPISQAALPKLVILRVHRLSKEPMQALAEAETWAERLQQPAALRDYHLVMGRSYLFFGENPERALAHLRAARGIGLASPVNDAATLAGIAELARERGHIALARESYEEFMKLYPRDQRGHMISKRLEELPAP